MQPGLTPEQVSSSTPASADPGAGAVPRPSVRRIRVAIVEDSSQWAEALKQLLEAEPDLTVTVVCTTLGEALRDVPASAPDVLLLDLRLPDGDGSRLIPMMADRLPECRVIVLTVAESDDAIRIAVANGAHGYLLKRAGYSRIVGAIREAHDGGAPFSAWVFRRMLGFVRESANRNRVLGGLTLRENELLGLLCGGGVSVKQAAVQMGLSEATARTYLQRIYCKMGITRRWELDRAYFNLGRPVAHDARAAGSLKTFRWPLQP